MPRKSETVRVLEIACRDHGWQWRRNAPPFERTDWFDREGESIRVVGGAWLGAPLNHYFIDHTRGDLRKIWIVQLGRRAQRAPTDRNTNPHIVLKAHHGKPRFTFALWFKNTFLTGYLDPAHEQLISERLIEAGLL